MTRQQQIPFSAYLAAKAACAGRFEFYVMPDGRVDLVSEEESRRRRAREEAIRREDSDVVAMTLN